MFLFLRRVIVVLALLVAFRAFPSLAQTIGKDGKLVIPQAGNLEERIVLLEKLGQLYIQFGESISHPGAEPGDLQSLRGEAIRLRQRTESAKLDEELRKAFADFIKLIDAFTDLGKRIQQITEGAANQNVANGTKQALLGGLTGTATYRGLRQQDMPKGEAATYAIAAAGVEILISGLLDWWSTKQVKDAAIKTAFEEFQKQFQERFLAAKSTAKQLAARYKWGHGETAFDLSVEDSAKFLDCVASGDFARIKLFFDEGIKSSPRDPFLRELRANYLALNPNATENELFSLAKDCANASSFIPNAREYDEDRADCFELATQICSMAKQRQRQDQGPPFGQTQIGSFAVAAARSTLQYVPTDPSGEVRNSLAITLVANNELREANELSRKLTLQFPNDPRFWYVRAAVLSREGDVASSFNALKRAVDGGIFHVVPRPEVLADIDFDRLRSERGDDFQDLAKIHTHYDVSDDLLWDDITLFNDSPFPITNVTFEVTLRQGATAQPLTLKTPIIEAHSKFTWVDCVNGISGKWDLAKSTRVLSCDQDP